MYTPQKAILFICVVLLSSNLFSDLYDNLSIDTMGTENRKSSIKITPDCVRPIKLRVINDNRDVTIYNDELHQYNECMTLFIHVQVEAANTTKDSEKRKEYVQAIDNAKSMLKSYNTLKDVEQNQKHESTVELGGLGYEEQPKSKQ